MSMMSDEEYEKTRCDYLSYFVFDSVLNQYSLQVGVTPEDVIRRYENYRRVLGVDQ